MGTPYEVFNTYLSVIPLAIYPSQSTLANAIIVLATAHSVQLEKDGYIAVDFTLRKNGVYVLDKIHRIVDALYAIRQLITKHNYTLYLPKHKVPYLGKYLITSILGYGATSIVYKATYNNNREVAIKVYKLGGRLNREEDAKQEIDVLVRIKQDNKCNIALCYETHEISSTGRISALVTTYLVGQDLRDISRTLKPDIVIDIAKQLLVALDYLESIQVAHRDIKQENVFFVGDGTIRLLDFGFACVLGKCRDIVGTAVYLDPHIQPNRELYKSGAQTLWIKADLWSAGILIWELATKLYYGRATIEETLAFINVDKYELPHGDLRELLAEVLVPIPTNRPTAKQLLQKYY